MHERALVSAAVQEVAESVAGIMPHMVRLAVGPDTSPGVIEEAWRSSSAGTSVSGVPIEIVRSDHVLLCLDCGSAFDGGKLTRCPQCGGNGLVVSEAPEISVIGWV